MNRLHSLHSLALAFIVLPYLVMAGEAAPFSKEAGARISKAFMESEREFKATFDKDQQSYFASHPIEATKVMLQWQRDVYRRVGYDYDATIRAVATRLRNTNNPIEEIGKPYLLGTPYQNIIEGLWLITGVGPENYSKNFDSQTLDSVNYLYENVLKRLKI